MNPQIQLPEEVRLSRPVAEAVIQYLLSRPLGEVYGLFAAVMQEAQRSRDPAPDPAGIELAGQKAARPNGKEGPKTVPGPKLVEPATHANEPASA